MWGWLAIGAVALGAVVCAAQYRNAARTHKPLSSRQPPRAAPRETPLGMEAIDMAEINRTNRRNESLERAHTNWTSRDRSMAAATDVPAMPDDETYATRFHTAFIKDKKDQTDD